MTTTTEGGRMATKLRAYARTASAFIKGAHVTATQVAGLSLIAAAGFTVALPLGLLVAGVFVCAIGYAMDK